MKTLETKVVAALSLPQQIAKILSDQILGGELKPGEGLPTEKSLAQTFNVSRAVVREAISSLKFEGLVQTRQGAGVFVSPNPIASAFRIPADRVGNSDDLAALFQLRMYVESAAAELAAQKATPQDVSRMTLALSEIEHCISSGEAAGEQSIIADLDFHIAVSEASSNPYLLSFIRFLNENLRRSIETGRRNSATVPGRAELVLQEHQQVLEAIVQKDPAAAYAAMYKHIQHSADRLGLKS
nr:FadR/GntR family transcriptional regulator [Shimia sp. R10_1]